VSFVHLVVGLNADAVTLDIIESVVGFVAVKLINPLEPEAARPVAGLSLTQLIVPGAVVPTVILPAEPSQ
jgi:hypothetical protein